MNSVATCFDKAAETYDDFASTQYQIGTTLIDYTKRQYLSSAQLIDLGCGTGRTTAVFAKNFVYQTFDAIDFAVNVLNKAKIRLRHTNINVHHANFDIFDMSQQYDIVFSNMALHWSSDLPQLLKKIASALSETGIVSFSLPIIGTFWELQNQFACQTFYSEAVLRKILLASGLSILFFHRETVRCHFENTHELLRTIKATGANYVDRRKHIGLCGKGLLKKNTIHQLTYQIIYVIAKRVS